VLRKPSRLRSLALKYKFACLIMYPNDPMKGPCANLNCGKIFKKRNSSALQSHHIMSQKLDDDLYEDPPFEREKQLNSESLNEFLIPGEYTDLKTATEFLENSLSQQRLHRIFKHLWIAGAPGKFRSLHEQLVFHHRVIPSEDPKLHLIWFKDSVYIKPLPPCLTNYEFFKKYICPNEALFSLACGLLYSYTNLIRHESDYRLAISLGLLRDDKLTWQKWQAFRLPAKAFLDKNPEVFDKRYRYGELRLSRLNIIWALKCGELTGYHNAYTRYEPYFSRYFTATVLVFAFATVTLNAMQVVLQQPSSDISPIFVTTSFRFSVAVLVSVVAISTFLLAVLLPIVVFDLRSGLIANKKLSKQLEARTQP
jgi:hypothetical protein